MNEFDLQAWQREIDAWRRRIASDEEAPQLRAELDHLSRDVDDLREHPESEGELRSSVERRLARLLSLYDITRRERARRS
jgi:hypothetical protein